MRRVTNEIVWAGVAAIVCGIVVASLLGGTGTPWLLVLVTVGAGLTLTIVRSRLAAAEARKADSQTIAAQPENEMTREVAPERRAVETRTRPTHPRALDAEAQRRAGARFESLRAGQAPRRKHYPPE